MSLKIAQFQFPHIIKLFYMLENFHLTNFFLSSNLKPSAPATSKCILIRACTGINGVSLAHHISYTSIVTFLLKFIFPNKHWRETFKEIKEKKKFFDDFLF